MSNGRLVPAPDDHSDGVGGYKTKRSDPAVVLVLVTPGARSGRHSTSTKVPTMAKRTRGIPPSDSETRYSAVKITPASSDSATVPSTHTSA